MAVGKPDAHTTMDRLQHPQRKSSLARSGTTSPPPERVSSNPIAILKRLEDKLSLQSNPSDDELRLIPLTDLETLAGHRSDLFLLQRHIGERIASAKGWKVGLSHLRVNAARKRAPMKDVDLSDNSEASESDSSTSSEPEAPGGPNIRGILYTTLLDSLASLEDFTTLYEMLTDLALLQCLLAMKTKSIERLVADLAIIKFGSGDYTTAASYLGRVVPYYAQHRWSMIETELVKIHAQCLKKLNRKDDYVRMTLSLLAKAAIRQRSFLELRVGFHSKLADPWVDDEDIESEGMLQELLTSSEELPVEVIVPLTEFFADLLVDPYIKHSQDKDGFQIDLKIRHLLRDDIQVDMVRLKLKAMDPPLRENWVECKGPMVFTTGINKITASTNVSYMIIIETVY